MINNSSKKWLGHLSSCLVLLALTQPSLTAAFGIPDFLEFGECAHTKPKANLDLNRYSGVWFAQEMVPNEYSNIASCSMTNYTWKGDFMSVIERGLSTENRKVRQVSIIRPDEEGVEGQMIVDAEGVPSAPYQVVATDYENYACVHSCMSFMGFRAAFSWIYTRKPNTDHTYVVLCRDLLAEQGVDPNPLTPVKQGKDCPYMEKLDQILAHTEMVLSQHKPAKTEEITQFEDITNFEEIVANPEVMPKTEVKSKSGRKSKTPKKSKSAHVDETYFEEVEDINELERELRDEEDHLLGAMEEERKFAEQERRIMEEQTKKAESEIRKMEDERQRMEEERARLEEERQIMKEDVKEEKEELKELRDEVRAEIRRNHRGNRQREGHAYQIAENSSSHMQNSIIVLLISSCMSVLIARL